MRDLRAEFVVQRRLDIQVHAATRAAGIDRDPGRRDRQVDRTGAGVDIDQVDVRAVLEHALVGGVEVGRIGDRVGRHDIGVGGDGQRRGEREVDVLMIVDPIAEIAPNDVQVVLGVAGVQVFALAPL